MIWWTCRNFTSGFLVCKLGPCTAVLGGKPVACLRCEGETGAWHPATPEELAQIAKQATEASVDAGNEGERGRTSRMSMIHGLLEDEWVDSKKEGE